MVMVLLLLETDVQQYCIQNMLQRAGQRKFWIRPKLARLTENGAQGARSHSWFEPNLNNADIILY